MLDFTYKTNFEKSIRLFSLLFLITLLFSFWVEAQRSYSFVYLIAFGFMMVFKKYMEVDQMLLRK